MLSDKFIDEMWSKCYWTRDYIHGTPVGQPWPGMVTMNSDQLRDLLNEIKTLTEKVKNPEITLLWGKPVSYWANVKAWMDSELPISDFLATMEAETGKLKAENERLQDSNKSMVSLWSEKINEIVSLKNELAELKQKLLELGGCPNANS